MAKNQKSSKTDHVLNILSGTKPKDENSATENRVAPPIVTEVKNQQEVVADAINDALNNELLNELAEEEAPEVPVSTSENFLVSDDIPSETTEDVASSFDQEDVSSLTEAVAEDVAESTPEVSETAPETVAESTPEVAETAPETVAESTPEVVETAPETVAEVAPEPVKSAPEPAKVTAEPSDVSPQKLGKLVGLDDGSKYINVMQVAVCDSIDKYLKMFNVCQCDRCVCDVLALTLTRLPPKYVVLNEMTHIPMMSFYASKYEKMINAQLIYSCNTVAAHPRH